MFNFLLFSPPLFENIIALFVLCNALEYLRRNQFGPAANETQV